MTVRIYVRESLASYDATHIHGRQLEYLEYDLATMEIVSEGIEYVPNLRFAREFRKCVMVRNGRVIGTCCVRSAVSAEFYKRKGVELWMIRYEKEAKANPRYRGERKLRGNPKRELYCMANFQKAVQVKGDYCKR